MIYNKENFSTVFIGSKSLLNSKPLTNPGLNIKKYKSLTLIDFFFSQVQLNFVPVMVNVEDYQ